jgi:hypothetical protein
MKFLHISSDPEFVLSKETFISPDFTDSYDSFIRFQRHHKKHMLCLAKSSDDGSSAWSRYVERERLASERKKMYEKCERYNQYIDCDIESSNLYIVDNVNDLFNLYTTYGIYKKKEDFVLPEEYIGKEDIYDYFIVTGIETFKELEKSISESDETFKTLNSKLSIYKNFIDNADKNIKNIIKTINDNPKHIPLSESPEICDGKVVISPKGINRRTVQLVLREISRIQKTLDNFEENLTLDIKKLNSPVFDTLDYIKMKEDGYNGIYYTSNIAKEKDAKTYTYPMLEFNETQLEILSSLYYSKDNGEDNHFTMEKYLSHFVDWLESDTLMVWNWIF